MDWEKMWVDSTDRLLKMTEENESLQKQLDIAIDFIQEIKNFKSDLVLRNIEKIRIDDKIKSANLRAGRKP
jgi:hypothetical protein